MAKDNLPLFFTLAGVEVSDAELDEIFNIGDRNSDGRLDFDEWVALMHDMEASYLNNTLSTKVVDWDDWFYLKKELYDFVKTAKALLFRVSKGWVDKMIEALIDGIYNDSSLF